MMTANLTWTSNHTSTACPPVYSEGVWLTFSAFVVTIIVSLLGLVGNTLMVAVNCLRTSRRSRTTKSKTNHSKTSTDVYITALAITDNLIIISTNLFAHRYIYPFMLPNVDNYTNAGKLVLVVLPFYHAAQFANTYTMTFLSVDRFLQIKHPIKSKRFCKPRGACIVLLVISIITVLFTIPRFPEYLYPFTIDTVDPCTGYFSFAGLGANPTYKLVYGFILHIIVMYVVPLATLVYTNFVLIQVIMKRNNWLKSLTSNRNRIQVAAAPNSEPSTSAAVKDNPAASANRNNNAATGQQGQTKQRSQNQIIITLVIIFMSFIMLQIPDLVAQFIWRLKPQLGPNLTIVSTLCLVLNSSINFMVYASTSPVFKLQLQQVVCCGRGRGKIGVADPNSNTYTNNNTNNNNANNYNNTNNNYTNKNNNTNSNNQQ